MWYAGLFYFCSFYHSNIVTLSYYHLYSTFLLNIKGLFAFVLEFWVPCALAIQSKKLSMQIWGEKVRYTPYSNVLSGDVAPYCIFALTLGAFGFAIAHMITG